MSVAVDQRVREIGIRMALGAGRRDIQRLVLKPGLVLGVCGVAAGVAAAAFLTRLMTAVLFAVAPTDVTTYVSGSVLLLLVTLAACYVPARRATRQNPLSALRVG
jgi:ABC-type antimicrobial peptide transport system permease subunit